MRKGITYQNKDVVFKILSETYKEKSFRAYGLDLPRIKAVLPTNLPAIAGDEKRMDNLFLLEDDTLAIVDYESEDKGSNRIKYINYVARVLGKYYDDNKEIPVIRLIIIYTGDVENACGLVNAGCLTLSMEQVFLVKLKSEDIYQHIKKKVEQREVLSEEDQMQLIILPLTEKGADGKRRRIEQVVDIVKGTQEDIQAFLFANLLVISDKFIDDNLSRDIRRWLKMTKVARLIAEDTSKEIAKKMLLRNYDVKEVAECTGLTEEDVEKVRQETIESLQKIH